MPTIRIDKNIMVPMRDGVRLAATTCMTRYASTRSTS
jgi:predicted acyl esterase